MDSRPNTSRPVTAVLLAAALTALSGCGEQATGSSQAALGVEDALAPGSVIGEAQHRRIPLHRDPGKVIRAPLLVLGAEAGIASDESSDGTRAPLPTERLFRVELRLLPEVDCSALPDWLMASRAFQRPAVISAAQLRALGEPGEAREIWIVPGYVRGSYRLLAEGDPGRRTLQAEARMSGDAANLDYRRWSGAAFDFGPPWFGIPLRQAGLGQTLLFPPSQDCSAPSPFAADTLPTQGFAYWGDRTAFVEIPAGRAFIARVIESCPVQLVQHEERLLVPGRYLWMPRVERWRYRAEIRAQCDSGEVRFDSYSLRLESRLGERRLSDAFRNDIARPPGPVW